MMDFDARQYMAEVLSQDSFQPKLAQRLWTYQVAQNPIMQRYTAELGQAGPCSIPISFFKHFELRCGDNWSPEAVFTSSGTTGQQPSRHLVRDLDIYQKNLLANFFHFFPTGPYRILALLPSYLERSQSSLVHMVQCWMDVFGLPGSGFYLYDFEALEQSIAEGAQADERLLLIGVSFALLDFAEQASLNLPTDAIVMETGGMKGRKEELIRADLHARLRAGLGVQDIYSEYGMTELLSQAYSGPDGRFRTPPSLQVWISDLHLDRLRLGPGETGRIHLVDLANVHSCAFIATDDLGRMHADGSFEVLGRLDTAELRGCNLMYV